MSRRGGGGGVGGGGAGHLERETILSMTRRSWRQRASKVESSAAPAPTDRSAARAANERVMSGAAAKLRPGEGAAVAAGEEREAGAGEGAASGAGGVGAVGPGCRAGGMGAGEQVPEPGRDPVALGLSGGADVRAGRADGRGPRGSGRCRPRTEA